MSLDNLPDLNTIVLNLIAPVTPTHIIYLGHGLFELRWALDLKPEELDSLHKNKTIQLRGKLFVPEGFPAIWKAIRFVHHLRDVDKRSKR